MPRAKLIPELKTAISDLTEKEKDKLIFRLLPKDQKLVHKLEYQLLEFSDTQEERRADVRAIIMEAMERYPSYYYSPGYLLLTLRELSGKITYHKDITSDKFGEIELNYLMLTEGLGRNVSSLRRSGYFSMKSLNEYVVKRVLKLQKLTAKLHEDYILEFEESMIQMGELLSEIPSMGNFIKEHDLDLDSLIEGRLPDELS
jgi:hypothetical protein